MTPAMTTDICASAARARPANAGTASLIVIVTVGGVCAFGFSRPGWSLRRATASGICWTVEESKALTSSGIRTVPTNGAPIRSEIPVTPSRSVKIVARAKSLRAWAFSATGSSASGTFDQNSAVGSLGSTRPTTVNTTSPAFSIVACRYEPTLTSSTAAAALVMTTSAAPLANPRPGGCLGSLPSTSRTSVLGLSSSAIEISSSRAGLGEIEDAAGPTPSTVILGVATKSSVAETRPRSGLTRRSGNSFASCANFVGSTPALTVWSPEAVFPTGIVALTAGAATPSVRAWRAARFRVASVSRGPATARKAPTVVTASATTTMPRSRQTRRVTRRRESAVNDRQRAPTPCSVAERWVRAVIVRLRIAGQRRDRPNASSERRP